MFGKKLLFFLTLLFTHHIARGFFFGPPPEVFVVDWLFGQKGKVVAKYNAVMEKPQAFAKAISGVLVGTVGTAIIPFAGILQHFENSEHPPTGDFACGPDNNQLAKDMAALAVDVTPGCPSKRDAMHKCCVKHDKCYTVLGVTQAECDERFCVCMKIATKGSGCEATAKVFCYLVIDHGKDSYDEAQEKSKAEKEATTAATKAQGVMDTDICDDPNTALFEFRLMPQCQDYITEIDNCCYNEPACGKHRQLGECHSAFCNCLLELVPESGQVSNENDLMLKLVVNSSAEPKPLALLASSGTCHFVNAFVQAAVVLVPVGVMLMRTVDVGIQFINI